ncbi:MAG: formyltransferase family protein, partial [Halobacteriaceae archaeon]
YQVMSWLNGTIRTSDFTFHRYEGFNSPTQETPLEMADNIQKATILIGRPYLHDWILESLKALQSKLSIEFPLVVVREENGSTDTRRSLVRENPVANWFKREFIEYRSGEIEFTDADLFEDTEICHCNPEREGARVHVPSDIVSRVARQTDVVIQFGFGILSGEILTAPDYGVVSFHHGDMREYRGGPAGFWEFLHGKDTAGVTVQQLSEQLDAGAVLAVETVDISDARTLSDVRERLYTTSPSVLVNAIERLSSPAEDATPPDELGPVYTSEDITPTVIIRFILRTGYGIAVTEEQV